MDCKEARELLSPYNDNELTERELHEVTEHLRTCRDCAFESGQILGIKRLIKAWEGVAGSEEFTSELSERARRSGRAGGRLLRLALAVIAAALVAAGVAFLVLYLRSGGSLGELFGLAPEEKPAPIPAPRGGESSPPELPAGVERRLGPVTLSSLNGSVLIEEAGGASRPARAGEEIALGRSVITAAGATAQLDLGGGFRAYLAAESAAAVGARDLRLRRGMVVVRFAGAARSAGPGPAEITVAVAAGACEVEAGGGELKLAVEFRADGTARVVVLRGWADVSRAGRILARVEAGQEASVDAAGSLTGPALARDVSAFGSVGEGD